MDSQIQSALIEVALRLPSAQQLTHQHGIKKVRRPGESCLGEKCHIKAGIMEDQHMLLGTEGAERFNRAGLHIDYHGETRDRQLDQSQAIRQGIKPGRFGVNGDQRRGQQPWEESVQLSGLGHQLIVWCGKCCRPHADRRRSWGLPERALFELGDRLLAK